PALWAVMVSLAATWQSAGVVPDAVVGHSQGEIAAAVVAGILSLPDAAAVVALRSRALRALSGRGGMVSVAEAADAVRERIAGCDGRLSVAAVNGPAATVVSGEPAALDQLVATCETAGVRARVLPVDYASHGPQVEALREEILAALDGIAPGPAAVPMISAMSGEWLAGPEADAGYWYDSLRAAVEFRQAVQALADAGYRAWIEVSPHPVLIPALAQTLDHAQDGGRPVDSPASLLTGTLRRHDGGARRFLAVLATAHVHGVPVHWPAVLAAGRAIALPTYAFRHQRYWPGPAPAPAGDVTAAGLGAVGHPLLGAAVELAAAGGLILTGRLSSRSQPWLAEHAVAGTALLPGTAFVELAIRAGDAAGCGRVEELTLEAPLVLPAGQAVQLQLTVGRPDEHGQRSLEVHARAEPAGQDGPWTRHASGLLAPAGAPAAGLAGEFTSWPPEGAVPADVTGLYAGLAAGRYEHGPAFRGLRAAWLRGTDVFAEVALPDEAGPAGFGLHPALFDAALHAAGLAGIVSPPGGVLLPFTWTGVSLHAAGATALRVRLRREGGGLSLAAADEAGAPVVSVSSLVFRPVTPGQLAAAGTGLPDALFTVEWVPVPAAGASGPVTADSAAPGVLRAGAPGAGAEAARAEVQRVLGAVQEWLGLEPPAQSRLAVVTTGAVDVAGEGVADLAGAAVWGLVRSAQSENPGRLVLVDLPPGGADEILAAVLGSDEPELAIRHGQVYARRLARPSGVLAVPGDQTPDGTTPWRLEAAGTGTLDGLALAPSPRAADPLAAGQVRVAVRAAGLNFRDVLISLGMYPGGGVIGSEIAGVVLETGPGVTGLATGDRVTGIAEGGGFGPVAVTEARLLTAIPDGWSFARAAAVPVAFATAWYGLVDLAGARPGQKLLVHAAAGGVGMAAVTIARHLGLDVYATASPGKWPVLAARGLDPGHIASSRDAAFEAQFLAATGGAGMDIVLNALAGELTDASLRLLPRGGAFVEMGKTDLRDPAQVAADHPGVTYHAFETGWAGQDRLAQIFALVVALLAAGELDPLPVRCWDVRRAPEAFRFMSQARHTGKLVLTIPPDPAAPRRPGTVLVTGGTGVLGGLTAGHLAVTGRARGLVLASRSGPAAPGAAGLAASLAAALAAGPAGPDAAVRVTACDAADRDALAAVLARIPAGAPLTGVVHAAGVLDDGVTGSLTPERVAAVMRPKADAAWHLHELTAGRDLDAFVLFSAAAATFGAPGQGSYAAGNAFLDGLACARRAAGQPAVSLGWGLWADASAMTGQLDSGDLARMARAGVRALSAEQGLALLDAALGR
ncbi:MAG TPA: acyltransferase domain-containing protein, partial [Streptosporangiaceae bacterium]